MEKPSFEMEKRFSKLIKSNSSYKIFSDLIDELEVVSNALKKRFDYLSNLLMGKTASEIEEIENLFISLRGLEIQKNYFKKYDNNFNFLNMTDNFSVLFAVTKMHIFGINLMIQDLLKETFILNDISDNNANKNQLKIIKDELNQLANNVHIKGASQWGKAPRNDPNSLEKWKIYLSEEEILFRNEIKQLKNYIPKLRKIHNNIIDNLNYRLKKLIKKFNIVPRINSDLNWNILVDDPVIIEDPNAVKINIPYHQNDTKTYLDNYENIFSGLPTFDHLRRYFTLRYVNYPFDQNNLKDYKILKEFLNRNFENWRKPSQIPMNSFDHNRQISEDDTLNDIEFLLEKLKCFLRSGLPSKDWKHPYTSIPFGSNDWEKFNEIVHRMFPLVHLPFLIGTLCTSHVHLLYLNNLLEDFHYYIEILMKRFISNFIQLDDRDHFELKRLFEDLKLCHNFSTHNIWRNKESHVDSIASVAIQLHENFRRIFSIMKNGPPLISSQTPKFWDLLITNYSISKNSFFPSPELEEFFNKNVDFNIPMPNENPPLLWAICEGNDPLAEWFLWAGVNPNVSDKEGNTALHLLAKQEQNNQSPLVNNQSPLANNQSSLVNLLLAAGAIPNLKNKEGKTPKELCSINGLLLNTFLKCKFPFTRQEIADQSYNINSSLNRKIDLNYCEKLLNNKDNFAFLYNSEGSLVLNNYINECSASFELKDEEIVRGLLYKGAHINQPDANGVTALDVAIANNGINSPLVQKLLTFTFEIRLRQYKLINRNYELLLPLCAISLANQLTEQLRIVENKRKNNAITILLPYYNLKKQWVAVVIFVPMGKCNSEVKVEYYDTEQIPLSLLQEIKVVYCNASINVILGNYYLPNNDPICAIENFVLASQNRSMFSFLTSAFRCLFRISPLQSIHASNIQANLDEELLQSFTKRVLKNQKLAQNGADKKNTLFSLPSKYYKSGRELIISRQEQILYARQLRTGKYLFSFAIIFTSAYFLNSKLRK